MSNGCNNWVIFAGVIAFTLANEKGEELHQILALISLPSVGPSGLSSPQDGSVELMFRPEE